MYFMKRGGGGTFCNTPWRCEEINSFTFQSCSVAFTKLSNGTRRWAKRRVTTSNRFRSEELYLSRSWWWYEFIQCCDYNSLFAHSRSIRTDHQRYQYVGLLKDTQFCGEVPDGAINQWLWSLCLRYPRHHFGFAEITQVSGLCVLVTTKGFSFYIDQAFTLLLPKLIPFGLFFQTASIYVTVCKSFLAIGPLQETLGAAVDCYVKVSRYSRSVSQPV